MKMATEISTTCRLLATFAKIIAVIFVTTSSGQDASKYSSSMSVLL